MRTPTNALSPRDQLMGVLVVLVWLALALVLRDSYRPGGEALPGSDVRPVSSVGEPDLGVPPPSAAPDTAGAKSESDK